MEREAAKRHEVIMAGIGGRGVLLASQLLAQAGTSDYKYVVWFPTYAQAMRGAECECTVILSDEEVFSPIVSKASAVVVMESSQTESFEKRVRPGGFLVLESSHTKYEASQQDIKVICIPAVEEAAKVGDLQVANFVLLGAYVQATRVVLPELVEKELERRFSKREELLSLNRNAFERGRELVIGGQTMSP